MVNAILANVFYGFPSKNLIVIGVTGTDGKTTTVNLIYHILNDAGLNASMISTVGASLEGEYEDIGLHVTTPSPWTIQKLLRKIANSPVGKKYVVIEVTSHALDQHRDWGIDFEVGALTNVTSEHLDYHKTFENYLKIKLRLIKKSKKAVVNKDDESYKYIKQGFGDDKKILTYSMGDEVDLSGAMLKINNPSLLKFNIYNVLAAVLTVKTIGVDLKTADLALKTFKLPTGRQDVVFENGFKVMIDFAHTPNSFEKLLSSVELEGSGRIIHVFGCAGQRDSVKRPVMGEISAKYAKVIILTAEDPRNESVEKITNDIELGIVPQVGDYQVFKISDRREAIAAAVTMAQKDDFVLITGKGHEKSMNFKGKELPWSDEEAIREALAAKTEHAS